MSPPLVLTAHGSADPRAAAVTHAIAGRIRRLRSGLDVQVAFCERHAPNLRDLLAGLGERCSSASKRPGDNATAGLGERCSSASKRPGDNATAGLGESSEQAVVSPLLLADAYHARVDIPAMIEASGARVRQAPVLGEDPALLDVLRQRLSEAGVSPDDSDLGVMVVAVGSSDPAANARTAVVASALQAGTRWAGTQIAFATGPQPSMAEAGVRLRAVGARRIVLAPWFLAHGRITDRIADYACAQQFSMTEPLGSHNLVGATVLDRYDFALVERAAA